MKTFMLTNVKVLRLQEVNKIYKLHKVFYGLKQAPRVWYSWIDGYLVQKDFKRSENKATLYVKKPKKWSATHSILICWWFVGCRKWIQFPKSIQAKYGEWIWDDRFGWNEIFYWDGDPLVKCWNLHSHKKYALEVLKKFYMERCKPVSMPLVVNEKISKDDGDNSVDTFIYKSIFGSILYLSATRPDIMFTASWLSRFMHSPSQFYLSAGKRIFWL